MEFSRDLGIQNIIPEDDALEIVLSVAEGKLIFELVWTIVWWCEDSAPKSLIMVCEAHKMQTSMSVHAL